MNKPEIDFPEGAAPTELTVVDIEVGDGIEVAPNDQVEIHYVGVDFETGEEFDSSWERGETATFPLQSLIRGWQLGIPGMCIGGRRELIIPPALAYGESGGHRLSGRTLIFVIDLIGIG